MAGDPTNVGHAGEFIVGVHIEDVFDGQGGAEEVSAGGVDDALGFARRAGGLSGIVGQPHGELSERVIATHVENE